MSDPGFNATTIVPITNAPSNPGEIRNLGLVLSAGTLTITDQNGIALSAANPGYVSVPSTTGGLSTILQVTTNAYFNDDSHALSSLTNLGFGITETADWAYDVPFFLYAVNRGDTHLNGIDGNSMFFLSRIPGMTSTPASANDIGDLDAIPANDSELVILILDSVTEANYTSLPCVLVGALRMQWSTATDDWTVQALGVTDGFGYNAIRATCSQHYVFPAGQNGAYAGRYLHPNGGTVPVFSTNVYYYRLLDTGHCQIEVYLNGDGGTDGAGAVIANLALPYVPRAPAAGSIYAWGAALITGSGCGGQVIAAGNTGGGNLGLFFQEKNMGNCNLDDFGNGNRTIRTTVMYPIISNLA